MDYMSYIWCAVFAFHLLSIVYWTGGSMLVAQTDRSIFKNMKSLEEQTLRLNAFRRFYRISWHVAPLALLSGGALMWKMVSMGQPIAWTYDAMATLGLIMFAIFLYVSGSALKKVARSLRPDAEQITKIRKQTYIMGMLGVLAILAGSLAHYNLLNNF